MTWWECTSLTGTLVTRPDQAPKPWKQRRSVLRPHGPELLIEVAWDRRPGGGIVLGRLTASVHLSLPPASSEDVSQAVSPSPRVALPQSTCVHHHPCPDPSPPWCFRQPDAHAPVQGFLRDLEVDAR